ncbi:D-citramalate synthase [Reichenbachiella faecimaris]|uniref:D-citramalate synthase n=1 Tax=Reichenbachiella faecimaris TaxID=692418 RepID=A0A1W2GJK0_REIFA|nr:alpha-isopropylmalate synthase regulatory domain-containing protein [Reichenbachiella faecimaris]SMD36724.1 D-citramalate synthase [Reichenbachiella faecimaris]
MKVEILDTTLRDGEQTSGVAFTESEKLTLAQLIIDELGVDRLEIASARVSEGEYRGAQHILDWANSHGHGHKIEILGFVDDGKSLDWIKEANGQVMNLLTKGSLKHCQAQLRKTPEEHLANIAETIAYADELGIAVNVYLEDWSNGMIDSPEYVYQMVEGLQKTSAKRIMLPDTLGVLNHQDVRKYCSEMVKRFPNVHFDFHAHNDYDLSVANVFEALKAGMRGIHTTLNGLGERAGNVPLSSVVGIMKDHLHLEVNLDETKLYKVSKVVEAFSGVRIPANKPLIGEFVFTQTSGVHADGDSKDNLYQTALEPTRFGRSYTYALGKLSGKSNILKNLEELGIQLSNDETKKVTERIIELGDKKESITQEDLPFIVNDVLGNSVSDPTVEILNYSLSVAKGLKPSATISVSLDGIVQEETAPGDGQYDAFMNALLKIYATVGRTFPKLVDYEVRIPPGGNTDALVMTTISWNWNGKILKTKGLDPDQTVAAIKATTRMLNIVESKEVKEYAV